MNMWSNHNSSAMSSSMQTPVPAQSGGVFNQDTFQERLQAIIEGERESWTYEIFWQPSHDYSGASFLGWGDGYYKGDEGKAKAKSTSSDAEQDHRKKVLRELNSLISGSSAPPPEDTLDEEVTDTEWFFLVSMTQSFINGGGLPGQAYFNSIPVWVAGADHLSASPCERVRQGQTFGLQTMVCVPSASGVVELGSTELIYQNPDLINQVKVLFNFNNNLDLGSSWPLSSTTTDQYENNPSSLWLNDPDGRDSVNVSVSVPTNHHHNNNQGIKTLQFETANPGSSTLTETPSVVNVPNAPSQNQKFLSRKMNLLEYGFDAKKGTNHHLEMPLISVEIPSFDDESKRSSYAVTWDSHFSFCNFYYALVIGLLLFCYIYHMIV